MSFAPTSPPPIFEGEDELQLKLKYARLIAGRPDRIRTAGYEIFEGPQNYGRAMQCAAWVHDPIVREECERLARDGGASEMHPTDDELDFELLSKARTATDPKVAKDFYELYLKARGRLQTGTNINNNIDASITNNRLVVPMTPGSPEEIAIAELRTEERQRKLLEHARSRATAH